MIKTDKDLQVLTVTQKSKLNSHVLLADVEDRTQFTHSMSREETLGHIYVAATQNS